MQSLQQLLQQLPALRDAILLLKARPSLDANAKSPALFKMRIQQSWYEVFSLKPAFALCLCNWIHSRM